MCRWGKKRGQSGEEESERQGKAWKDFLEGSRSSSCRGGFIMTSIMKIYSKATKRVSAWGRLLFWGFIFNCLICFGMLFLFLCCFLCFWFMYICSYIFLCIFVLYNFIYVIFVYFCFMWFYFMLFVLCYMLLFFIITFWVFFLLFSFIYL